MKTLLCIVFIIAFTSLSAQKQNRFAVNFDFNKYEITTESAARLDSFVNATRLKPITFTIELYGHCDSVGSNEYNDALSLKRTEAVKNYLADKGIQSNSILKEKGYGERQPLNNNVTDYERFLNRRVEIVELSTDPVVEIPIVKPVETLVEETITKLIEDTATRIGAKLVLRNLNFIGGRHYLLPESFPVLEELLAVMNSNPKLEISIEGHVCCLPDKNDGVDFDLGTQNLSAMRAKTVYDYLIKNGTSPKRISYRGFGHQFPITPYPESTPEEMTKNRRVEIKIISK